MKARKKLGEILVEGGLLTQEQLEKALPYQKKSNLKLGQFLVREGIVSESQIVDLVSSQLKLEKYRPDRFTVDVELAQLLSAEIAHKCQAAPLKKSGMLLTVAMTDPLDINSLDTIEVHTNYEVEAVICTEQHLNQLLSTVYGTF
ncbi:MAG: general secretion pathway protein GspE, partial [Desulfobacterales bacterium]|nr:general secretion pathway protein GspE [Desulfobacterales bacterium]